MTVIPLVDGPLVTIGQLQRSFGPVAGAVMGYGEGEFGEDGRLQWCASVLPGQAMSTFLNRRRIDEKAAQRDPDKPFLILLGSLKRAQDRGGVPNALFGIGLAAPVGAKAETILHPHHLARRENIKDGHFRWPVGVPLLRAWLSDPPAPFSTIICQPHRAFGSSDGNRVVPLDQLIPGLVTALLSIPVQEAVLDRPFPLPPFLAKLERKWREGKLRVRTGKEPVRDPAVVGAALAANLVRFGTYRCEECAYEPAKDTKVPSGKERSMLDVHHVNPIAGGERETALADVIVLCPMCHRREHLQPVA